MGRVTLRRNGAEITFEKGDRFSADVLREGHVGEGWQREAPAAMDAEVPTEAKHGHFW